MSATRRASSWEGRRKRKIMLKRDKENDIVFEDIKFSSVVLIAREIEAMEYKPCATFSPCKWISCGSAYI